MELSKQFKRRVKNIIRFTQTFRSFQEFFFNLTYQCPLACKYCYIDPNLKGMTLEEVDYIMSQLSKDKFNYSRTITFFGGEPALQIDIIEAIIRKYYNEMLPGTNERKFRFGIITGFTVNQERLLKLYEEFPFEIIVSYDNPRNEQRLDRSGKPFSSYQWFADHGVDIGQYSDNLALQKTVSGLEKSFSSDIEELMMIKRKHNINYCWAHNRTPYEGLDYDKLTNEYKAVINMHLDALLGDADTYIPKILATEFLAIINHDMENCGGCGLMTELFISSGARVFPCSISNSVLERFELSDEDNTEYISDAESCYLANDTCESCSTKYFCNGGCLVTRYTKNQEFYTPDSNWCKYIKAIEEAYYKALSKYTEEEMVQLTTLVTSWKIGFYHQCTSPVNNHNILGGTVV